MLIFTLHRTGTFLTPTWFKHRFAVSILLNLENSTLVLMCCLLFQVMKTAEKMKEEGFTEISTVECLLRELQVRKITQSLFDPLRPFTERETTENDDDPASKKVKVDDENGAVENVETPKNGDASKAEEMNKTFVTAVPLLKMPGHTGYLTFATLPPNPKYED